MRAIVYRKYGAAEVLEAAQRPKPEPGPGEILIRVRAVEVTKADTELRSMKFPVNWFLLPLRLAMGWNRPKKEILGAYFAGQVEELGDGCARFSVGDSLFGAAQFKMGAYAEYLTLPEGYTIAHKPKNMSFEEAAAVPLGALNALHFMRLAKLLPGQRVLINGGGGSIGSFALQIAKARGAWVTAVDAPHKEAMLRELGVDEFVDYETQDFALTDQKYDVVFDMVASSSYPKCLSVLNERGSYLSGNPSLWTMARCLATRCFTKRSASFTFAAEKQEELESLVHMIEEGQVRAVLDQVLPLESAAEAHQRVETEQRVGMVVLSTS